MLLLLTLPVSPFGSSSVMNAPLMVAAEKGLLREAVAEVEAHFARWELHSDLGACPRPSGPTPADPRS